jgi:hypothetical protein
MNKVTSLYGVAFAFPNYAVMWSAVDGELGAYLRSSVSMPTKSSGTTGSTRSQAAQSQSRRPTI